MSKGFVNDALGKFGPFGKYNEAQVVTNTTTQFTASAGLGAAAIIVSGSSLSGRVTLARGGDVEVGGSGGLTTGTIHELGIFKAVSDNATTHIIVLKR